MSESDLSESDLVQSKNLLTSAFEGRMGAPVPLIDPQYGNETTVREKIGDESAFEIKGFDGNWYPITLEAILPGFSRFLQTKNGQNFLQILQMEHATF